MGILRNIGKGITTFLFSIFLALLLLTFLLYNITAYENMKNIFITAFRSVLLQNMTSQEIEEKYSMLSSYCKTNAEVTLPIDNITLRCSEILEKDSSGFVNLIMEKIFDNFYFKNYECNFIDCLKEIRSGEDIAVVFSSLSHNFFEKIFGQLLMATVVTGIALFFLIETWDGRFKVFGLEFLSIGVFFFFLSYFKVFLIERIPKDLPIGENVLDIVFNQLSSILLIFLILGVAFFVAWILMKFFGKSKKPK
ncbi:MAG: hypothetical protein QXU74_00965 [Candidatus Aenigmatarchaeota archaeon]